MNTGALHVMLVQELGWTIEHHEQFLTGYWDVAGEKRQLVFFIDDDDGMIYISTRFDDLDVNASNMETLLKENMKRALVKLGMDSDGHVVIMAELPADATAGAVREAVFRVSRAAAWHAEHRRG